MEMTSRLDAENNKLILRILELEAERDEARAAVRRLAGALDGSLHDTSIEAHGAALQALADPVVRRIVEGE
jgi:hypothetical protein